MPAALREASSVMAADIDALAFELAGLVAAPAPPGREDEVAEVIRALLGPLAATASRDSIGNLRVTGGQRPPRILVTAHMDQVGFMVSDAGSGDARCVAVGGPVLEGPDWVAARVLGEQRVFDAELRAAGEETAVLRCRRPADVRVGDRVVFGGGLERGPGTRVCGPALDNRLGCLLAVHAARAIAAETDGVAFAWTVQEETTQAGAIRVARDLQPDAVVAVDVTPAVADTQTSSVISVGAGPALTLLDGGMVADAGLLEAFAAAARRLGVPWQPEVTGEGISEAGHVQATLGIPALALLIPIDDAHGPVATGDLRDVRAAIELLVGGLRQVLSASVSPPEARRP